MKKPILIVLIYLCIQIALSSIEGLIFLSMGLSAQAVELSAKLFAPTLILSMLLMLWFLRYKGGIPVDKKSWSFVSIPYLLLTLVLSVSFIPLSDGISYLFRWMPDFTKTTFDAMSSGIVGIITMTILGPIFEEVLFRGTVTKLLLQKYNPMKAIIISALIFGIFHLNPAQIIPAFVGGLVLASLYYRTGSLIPGIILHICINTTATITTIYCNDSTTSICEMVGTKTYIIIMLDAVFFFIASAYLMKRITDKRKKADETNKDVVSDSSY